MTRQQRIEKTIRDLKALSVAFSNMSDNYSGYPSGEGALCDEELSEHYPFDRCFSEVTSDVLGWVEESIEQLRKEGT